MRKFIFFLLFLAGNPLFAAAQPASAVTPAAEVLRQATKEAGVQGKKVLLIFHASWCGWCRKMDKSLRDSSCRDYFDKSYVITHLTVQESPDKKHLENPGADSVLRRFFGRGMGLPYWVILDEKGQWLADARMREPGQGREEGVNSGCPAAGPEVEHFIGVLKQTSSLSTAEEEAVRRRFRQNE